MTFRPGPWPSSASSYRCARDLLLIPHHPPAAEPTDQTGPVTLVFLMVPLPGTPGHQLTSRPAASVSGCPAGCLAICWPHPPVSPSHLDGCVMPVCAVTLPPTTYLETSARSAPELQGKPLVKKGTRLDPLGLPTKRQTAGSKRFCPTKDCGCCQITPYIARRTPAHPRMPLLLHCCGYFTLGLISTRHTLPGASAPTEQAHPPTSGTLCPYFFASSPLYRFQLPKLKKKIKKSPIHLFACQPL